tara:strand:+ start:445 stop:2919 length:2475 start_codon:yes stop_codon:yes gene_type:complete
MKNGNFLLLCIVTLLVFGNTLSNGYNLDDYLVTNNNVKTNPNTTFNLASIFSTSYLSEGTIKSGYRPVTIATFYLEHQLFGESAKVSHVINLVLFLGVILLLYQLLNLLFKNSNSYILLFVALLFSVHSVHSEVVASIKNRDEILCLLFFIAAGINSISWINRKNSLYLVLTLLLVSFSLLSKKSALPVIALLPVLLLHTNKIKVSQYITLGLVTSIPIGVCAFNFQVIPGLVIFVALNLFYLMVLHLPEYWKRTSLPTPSVLEVIILCAIFSLSIIGLFFHQLYLIIGAQLLLLILAHKNFKAAIIFNVIITLSSYFVFFKVELLIYLIILVSASVLVQKNTIKFNYKNLLGLIPLLLLIAYNKGDYTQGLIYLSPLLVFVTVLFHRFLQLTIGLLSVAVSLYFNELGYVQLGVLLFSVLVLSKIEVVKKKKLFFAGWLCIAYLFIGATYENEEINFYFNSNITEKSIGVDQQKLREGRNLEFLENTLVAKHTLEERFATGLLTMGTYLGLMVYPKELSFYYGYSKINTTNFKDYKVWISLFSYLLLFYCAIYFFKKQPLISIGAIWFISCILLFSNLPVLVAGMVGERLAFSGSLGFCMMIGGVINWINPQFSYKKIRGLEALSILLLLAFSLRTFARNEKWESTTVLMSNDIEHLENSAQANYLLGVHSIKKTLKNYKGSISDIQEIQQSIKYFKRAIEIEPKHYDFHLSLAKAYLSLDENDLAKRSLEDSYALAPKALISLFELAKINFMLKEYKQAISYSSLYLEQSTNNHLIYEMAAFGAYYLDDYELSISYAKEGLNQFPQNEKLNELFFDLQRRMP